MRIHDEAIADLLDRVAALDDAPDRSRHHWFYADLTRLAVETLDEVTSRRADENYRRGHEDGYARGHDDGYQRGRDDGHRVGCRLGATTARNGVDDLAQVDTSSADKHRQRARSNTHRSARGRVGAGRGGVV